MKMCQAMAQEGHAPVLYTVRRRGHTPNPTTDIWRHYGVTVRFPIRHIYTWPRLRDYDYVVSTLWQAQKDQPDLVYTRHPVVAALSARLGIATIYEMHDLPGGHFGPYLLRLFLSGAGCLRLVMISGALRRMALGRYPTWLQGKSLVVAHDGVDLERFSGLPSAAEAREQLGLSDGFTVGYSGHLYPGRGIELIFELAQSLPQVRFLILGGQADSVAKHRQEAAKRKFTNIHLQGFVPNADLPLYLAACDVLVMPYQRRVMTSSGNGDTTTFMSPMKLFEYMAVGRLIISSDLPVLREVLNEQNAMLCAPEDKNAWRLAIERAMTGVQWRDRLAQTASRDAEQYTWRRRVRRCLGLGVKGNS